MRAVSRVGGLLLAGALALAPWAARAQEAPPPSDTPATDAIGPKALQNFSLNGTVTRAADQPVPVAAAPAKRQASADAQSKPPVAPPAVAPPTQTATERTTPQPSETASAKPPILPKVEPATAPAQLRQSPPSSSVTVALPNLDSTTSAASSTPSPGFAPPPDTPGTLAPEHKLSLLPWLLAAFVAALGGAFLFWRNRSREAFAGVPQVDAFTAPPPAASPRPAPAPAPAPAPKPPSPAMTGIVSTRLRPWIDIGFQPLRCILEDQRVVVEFELELFNSGSAAARAVLVEASLFNAGPTQERDVRGFFANPAGQGERIVSIPPLKRVAVRTQVVVPRTQVQQYELAGRQVFVPVIAFNALYRWSGGEGQTSISYLLGRDTKGEKMAPFRLDLGPRIFRGLAAHLLPDGIRQ